MIPIYLALFLAGMAAEAGRFEVLPWSPPSGATIYADEMVRSRFCSALCRPSRQTYTVGSRCPRGITAAFRSCWLGRVGS